jgi:hypothetical protein
LVARRSGQAGCGADHARDVTDTDEASDSATRWDGRKPSRNHRIANIPRATASFEKGSELLTCEDLVLTEGHDHADSFSQEFR